MGRIVRSSTTTGRLGMGLAWSTCAMTLIVGGLITPATGAEEGDAVASLVLRDVQALNGGHNLYLRGDGTGIVETIYRPSGKNLHSRSHAIKLNADRMAGLASLIRDRKFSSIVVKKRQGVPEEVLVEIRVRFSSGAQHSVSKWSGDPQTDFDTIRRDLLKVIEETPRLKDLGDAPYDPNAVPAGFEEKPSK